MNASATDGANAHAALHPELPPAVWARFRQPLHVASAAHIAAATHRGAAGESALGTAVSFYLQLIDGRCKAAHFRVYGCPYTIATCDWLAERLHGAPADIGALGAPESWARALATPLERLGRLLVVEDALRAAFCYSPRP